MASYSDSFNMLNELNLNADGTDDLLSEVYAFGVLSCSKTLSTTA